MTRGRWIVYALVSLFLVAGVAYYWAPWQTTEQTPGGKGKKGKKGKKGGPNTSDPVPILAVTAKVADVPDYLDGVGTAKALNTVTVRPQVDGKLISVSFSEGQDVPKGFVLAKIDPATYQAMYDQAVAKKAQDEAMLANAKLDLERYIRLAATNAVNKQQVDTTRALVAQLEAQVKADQAAIDNARTILSYTDIVAPIAGRTGIRMVDEGNIVHASDANGIVIITQLKPISVMFNLPQQELPKLNRGLAEGPLPIDALGPDGTVVDKGKVLVIDNQVDQTTGTVKLKAEFPNANLQLWPGQFANVRLLIETLYQIVVVPTAAIQRGPTGTFVYVVQSGNTVTVRPVTVRLQDDQQAAVQEGLSAGEIVVTSGFGRLREGERVVIDDSQGQVDPGTKGKGKGGKGRRIPPPSD